MKKSSGTHSGIALKVHPEIHMFKNFTKEFSGKFISDFLDDSFEDSSRNCSIDFSRNFKKIILQITSGIQPGGIQKNALFIPLSKYQCNPRMNNLLD